MDGLKLGPVVVIKETYSSRWRLEGTRKIEDAHVSIRATSKNKEMRIETTTSNMIDIFLLTQATCDDHESGRDMFSITLPSYSIRLIIHGNDKILEKIHHKVFLEALAPSSSSSSRTVIPKPNAIKPCPVRSDSLSSNSAVISPELQSKKRLLFGASAVRPSHAVPTLSNGKAGRWGRSGLTPPEKKGNFQRSPQQLIAQKHDRENQPPNCPDNCVRNLSSLLDEVEERAPADSMAVEQEEVLKAVQNRQNVFFTGGAGTGKSTLLKKIVQWARNHYKDTGVFVTATTGLAACAIQGSTLHQLFGIPAVSEDASEAAWGQLLNKTIERRVVAQRLRAAQVIIIDEVSMLGPRLFEFMDQVLRRIRGSDSVMGDVQIVCCGDFFQLPPVQPTTFSHNAPTTQRNREMLIAQGQRGSFRTRDDEVALSQAAGGTQRPLHTQVATTSDKRRYCFQSALWSRVFPPETNAFVLSTVYRQQTDPLFAAILEDIRLGRCTAEQLQELNDCCHGRQLPPLHGIQATQILTHKKDVDAINSQRLEDLPGTPMTYAAQDTGDEAFVRMLQRHCPAKTNLELKVGAQVVLVKTTQPSEGLVNGARGVVVRFHRETRWPVVKFANGGEYPITYETFPLIMCGRVLAQRSQLPLDLAWAISVHRAQGMTVEQGEVDVKNAFEFGQIYVALSRVRHREGLSLRFPIALNQIKVDTCVQDFYSQLQLVKRQSKAAHAKPVVASSVSRPHQRQPLVSTR